MQTEQKIQSRRKQVKSFQDLEVWQDGHRLVLEIYRLSGHFPIEEKYSSVAQLRRAVLSITANIAESFGRFHYREKLQFLYNARGSVEEAKNHLIAARDLQLLSLPDYENVWECLDAVARKLNRLIEATRQQLKQPIAAAREET